MTFSSISVEIWNKK